MAGELWVFVSRPGSLSHLYRVRGSRVGWDLGLGYAPGPHSPRFREFRRLFQHFMGPRAAQEPSVLQAQEKNATKLLRRLLVNPRDFMAHVRQ